MIGCSMKCDYRRGTTSDILRFHEFLETIWIKEYNKGNILSIVVKKNEPINTEKYDLDYFS